MEVFEAIKTRRSIRQFSDKDVSRELIEKILDAGLAAPSAGNLQARDFFVTADRDMKEKLANAAFDQMFIARAPFVIVVCSNLERIKPYGPRGETLYCIQDASASVQNMLLTIHSLGLASCWIGAFDEKKASRVLELPKHLRPVAMLPIGYPGKLAQSARRGTMTFTGLAESDVHRCTNYCRNQYICSNRFGYR